MPFDAWHKSRTTLRDASGLQRSAHLFLKFQKSSRSVSGMDLGHQTWSWSLSSCCLTLREWTIVHSHCGTWEKMVEPKHACNCSFEVSGIAVDVWSSLNTYSIYHICIYTYTYIFMVAWFGHDSCAVACAGRTRKSCGAPFARTQKSCEKKTNKNCCDTHYPRSGS